MTTAGPVWTVLGPEEGELLGDPQAVMDRFLVESTDSAGRLALVEHRMAPKALAAPLHLHTREDEYSFIIEGEVGAYLGGSEIVARQGDLVAKPRDQWHTFWNAGTTPARILEIICPAGLEKLFRLIDLDPDLFEPDKLTQLAKGDFGVSVDFEGTLPIMERHELTF